MIQKIYTVTEVSKILRVNKNFVYALIKKGELKAVKLGSIKIKENDLNNYINNLT